MKNLLTILFIAPLLTFSQSFEIKRAVANGISGKIKGTITIKDSTIQIKTKASDLIYNIKEKANKNNAFQYLSVVDGGVNDTEVRFVLKESDLFKNSDHILTIDSVDLFNNKTTSITYFVKTN